MGLEHLIIQDSREVLKTHTHTHTHTIMMDICQSTQQTTESKLTSTLQNHQGHQIQRKSEKLSQPRGV